MRRRIAVLFGEKGKLTLLPLLLICVLLTGRLYAQQAIDLSNTRVEELTDEQVRRFMLELNRSGIGDDQWEKLALQNGMNPVEIVKLKTRLQATRKALQHSSVRNSASSKDQNADINENSMNAKPVQPDFGAIFSDLKLKNFGAVAFNNPRISFEPNLNLPTPRNYVLAANDEIQIEVSGVSEASYKLKVSAEGVIRIPVAGPVSVSGLTIEEARRSIVNRLSNTIYSSIKTGRTRVDVSLSSIRSIRVTIIGEATVPGTYTLPSLATAFNALYACGGPNPNGSYRDIQVIRNNKLIASIDVYQFLLSGNKKNDVQLRDQDIIRINSYSVRVELKGEVKRPGQYDVAKQETLQQVLSYAGGFTENAYTAKIQVFKSTNRERKVSTLNETEFVNTLPGPGDVYIVGKILNRFSNRVNISGAVYRPGDYELKDNMTLLGLIEEADGLREDAFMSRGVIHRLKPDLGPEIISFDIEKIKAGNSPNIVLNKEDRIEIYSKFDLKEGYYVKIDGEVSAPGTFLYEDSMRVLDLILLSGGLKESSSLKRVEISRRVKDTAVQLKDNPKTALIFQQEIRADLRDSSGFQQFVLEPFDEVVIRTAPGYYVQKNVVIEGEILYSGKYTLEAKNDRISDLVKRAGGLTPTAYLKGAVLVRTRNFNRTEQSNYEQGLKNLVKQNITAGTSPNLVEAQVLDVIQKKSDFVGIDLERILENPQSEYDLFLNDGDTLRIPKQLQTVRVSGEVLYPTLVRYDEGLRFKDYVIGAGGFGDRASRKRSYVVYPNGSVKGTKHFLFFKNYPHLSPGAEIYVPIKRERERLKTGEVITLGATLVSMLAILFNALR